MEQLDSKFLSGSVTRRFAIICIGLFVSAEVMFLVLAWRASAETGSVGGDDWYDNQGHAIQNNLREIAITAQQYMKDKSADHVSVHDLLGDGDKAYIRSLSPVCGEKYDKIIITSETRLVSITVPDGHRVMYRLTADEVLVPPPTSSPAQ